MNAKNKKTVLVLAIVAVLVGIVAWSMGGAGGTTDIAQAGKAKFTYIGDKDCADCETSFKYVQQAAAGQDVIVEFVDQATQRDRIPAVAGADAEGALVNTCDAGDHVTLVNEGGTHFASVEEARAAVGASAGGEQVAFHFTYGSDGCADCEKVADAFAQLSQKYPANVAEFIIVDVEKDPAAAEKARLTKPHMTTMYDDDGCTGTLEGVLAGNAAEVEAKLQAIPIIPASAPAQ